MYGIYLTKNAVNEADICAYFEYLKSKGNPIGGNLTRNSIFIGCNSANLINQSYVKRLITVGLKGIDIGEGVVNRSAAIDMTKMLLREPIVIVLLVIVAVFLPLTANADGVFGASKHDIEKTLFLIVEATQENTPALSDLEFCLSCVSNYINPYWFNQFVLISFDASGIRSADGFFTTDDARVALESILKNPLPSNNGSDLPLLESVIHGLSSFTFNPQSVVYLITTAGSSVSDQVNGPTFFKALLGWQVQLQYILVNSTQSNHTLSTQSTRFVADLAVTTGGNFIGLTTPFEMTNFINAHLPTLYDSAFIGDATQGSFSCVQTTYYTAIEANVGTVYLYVYSNSVDPSVRSKYNIISLKWLFDDIYARIYSFTPVDGPGIYTVSLSDIGPCSLQIRSQSAPEATATTQIPTKSTTTGSTQIHSQRLNVV
uniref:VWFA domain-containing protein n=1 Tax=Panagrellus redivivus TaxID=6233 RepID=A0A7E4VR08_PANRE